MSGQKNVKKKKKIDDSESNSCALGVFWAFCGLIEK